MQSDSDGDTILDICSNLCTEFEVNWNLCFICQTFTNEKLQCPADSKRCDVGVGYKSFADILPAFADACNLPPHLRSVLVDNGTSSALSAALAQHRAKWHKSCRLLYYPGKLEQAAAKQTRQKKREGSPTKQPCAGESMPVPKRICTRAVCNTEIEIGDSCIGICCLFCDKPNSESERLHDVTTFELDRKIKNCATKLTDITLLTKLSRVSDVIALGAKYHTKCLANLYNRVRALNRKSTDNEHGDVEKDIHSLAFAQLVAYVDQYRNDTNVTPIFKLCDIAKMYNDRIHQLGGSGTVHSTRLKEQLLTHFSDMRAHDEGRGRPTLLMFDYDIGPAVLTAAQTNCNNDALCLSRAAEIVRRSIFQSTPPFNGSFATTCQTEGVPKSLLALVSMILEGPAISDQSCERQVHAAAEIAQLLVYNCVNRPRCTGKLPETTKHVRHNREQETALPLYTGLYLYVKTRKETVIDKLSKHGLSVPYDRVFTLTGDIASAVCDSYNKQQIVCPPQLCNSAFTVGAVDNIDHNPSSSTAKTSFHGTAISLMQHPDLAQREANRPSFALPQVTGKRSLLLPQYYSNIEPVMLNSAEPTVPEMPRPLVVNNALLSKAVDEEYTWLHAVKAAVVSSSEASAIDLTWSVFHSRNELHGSVNPALTTMLPLFRESSNSVAMIKHAMDVIAIALNTINPGQTPVMACDQPLYALAKIIQWNFPELYGESQFVVMLGGLHIEMAALKGLGKLLTNSGWVEALAEAGLYTPGTAESFLTAAHVRRCRHAHEVTAASLYILQHHAYTSYKADCSNGNATEMSFEAWCSHQMAKQPQFAFWSLILQFEIAVLLFVRSIRTANFQLYTHSLINLAPWFFAMDRTHYARWVPVHIRDMTQLTHTNASVFSEFVSGKFVVNKTGRAFSAIAIDQAHEQLNAAVKGDGGIIGLTENETALRRWLIASPEIARLLDEFESSKQDTSSVAVHHEERPSVQNSFRREIKSLIAKMEEFGNPFEDDSETLSNLQSKQVVASSVAVDVNKTFDLGKAQYNQFVTERLVERSVSIFQPLKQNKIAPFVSKSSHQTTKAKWQLTSVKKDCVLFSQLYIGCEIRGGDVDDFFQHENQSVPPSLSDCGNLRFSAKSDLLTCLEKLCAKQKHILLDGLAVVLDGAAIVQMLKPSCVKTFGEYAADVFIPYIAAQLRTACRVDLVWDRYYCNSLKATARASRGLAIRRLVGFGVPIPQNWQAFLRSDLNKTELFRFLSEAVSSMTVEAGKQLVVTLDHDVVSVPELNNVSALSPCSHEEADTRMILHAADAAARGIKRICIKTVDTDVVVLAVAYKQHIACKELWVAFGTGKHFRYIPTHEIAASMGQNECTALPVFHAISGCDSTSSFAGKGKKTAWENWKGFPAVTAAFLELSACPSRVSNECFAAIESFVVLLYDRKSSSNEVNITRKQLFAQKGRTLENIPPTKDALLQHVKRAAYQSGFVWGQCLIVNPDLPSPSNWGWASVDDVWQPVWITQPSAAGCCQELLRCGCKSGCKNRRCKCLRANLKCTTMCGCAGECRPIGD